MSGAGLRNKYNARGTFKLMKTVAGSNDHCCVPGCSASGRYNSVLSFHRFPQEPTLRAKWLHRIQRADFTVTKHTKVCSRHFEEHLIRPTALGRRVLSRTAVPTLFHWNNYSVKRRAGIWEHRTKPSSPEPEVEDIEDEEAVPKEYEARPTSRVDREASAREPSFDYESPDFVPSIFPHSSIITGDSTAKLARYERQRRWEEPRADERPSVMPDMESSAGRKSENPCTLDYIPNVFPVIVKTDTGIITLPVMRDQKARPVRETSWTRADVPITPGQTVADLCESSKGSPGILAKRAPKVKQESVIEVIVGETGQITTSTNVSEPPETFSIEGRYGTWERATVEAIMSLKVLGTTVTTAQVSQTIIANLKDENEFLCVQNANMEAELKAKQWMHEQEVRDLQERLEALKQKCSCGAVSVTTNTPEAALSDVMVVEIKTEPDFSEFDLQENSIY